MANQVVREYGPEIAIASGLKRVSWGAVFAGVLVSFMVSLLLAFLGLGIGLSTIKPTEEADPISGMGIGAAIWWVVSTLASLFIGGCVAGRLAGVPRRADSMLHGVLTWSLNTVLMLALLGTVVGGLIGGAAGLVRKGADLGQGAGPTLAGITQGAEAALEQRGIPVGEMTRNAQQALPKLAQDPQGAKNVAQAMQDLMKRGPQNITEADRQKAVAAISPYANSEQEAAQLVDSWVQTAQAAAAKAPQMEQRAREAGEKAASGMAKASLWAFAGLLLSGLAAAIGGRAGTPRDIPLAPEPAARA